MPGDEIESEQYPAEEAEDPDDRAWPINFEAAKFMLDGRELDFEAFVAETAGSLAERPRHRPVPQPAPQPKDVVWQARKPA